MRRGKSGRHLSSFPRRRKTGVPSLAPRSLGVRVAPEFHLLLPEMPRSPPRGTKAQPHCLHHSLRTRWNLLIILQPVRSIPLRPLAQGLESQREARRTQRAVRDKGGWPGCGSIRPLLLLATDLSLRWEDKRARPRREGFPLRPPGSCLISASTRVAERESKPAAALGDYAPRARLTFGCLIHSGVWVKAATFLAGPMHWHRVQRMNSFEVSFRKTWKGIVHLGIQCERTVSHQQMGAVGSVGHGDQMGEPQSVEVQQRDDSDS